MKNLIKILLITLILTAVISCFTVVNAATKSKVTTSQTYNSSNNEVTVKIKSNIKLKKKLKGWKLSSNKKTYSKVYKANKTEKVTVTNVNGKKTTKTIKVTKIKKMSLTAKYTTNKDNTVTVKVTSNVPLKKLSGWILSSNKKTLTKKYTENYNKKVTFTDNHGNTKKLQIKVAGIKDIIESVKITTPTKTTYNVNDIIDLAGGKIDITYNSGKKEQKDLTYSMLDKIVLSNSGIQSITIKYEGYTQNYIVIVNESTPTSEDTPGESDIPGDNPGGGSTGGGTVTPTILPIEGLTANYSNSDLKANNKIEYSTENFNICAVSESNPSENRTKLTYDQLKVLSSDNEGLLVKVVIVDEKLIIQGTAKKVGTYTLNVELSSNKNIKLTPITITVYKDQKVSKIELAEINDKEVIVGKDYVIKELKAYDQYTGTYNDEMKITAKDLNIINNSDKIYIYKLDENKNEIGNQDTNYDNSAVVKYIGILGIKDGEAKFDLKSGNITNNIDTFIVGSKSRIADIKFTGNNNSISIDTTGKLTTLPIEFYNQYNEKIEDITANDIKTSVIGYEIGKAQIIIPQSTYEGKTTKYEALIVECYDKDDNLLNTDDDKTAVKTIKVKLANLEYENISVKIDLNKFDKNTIEIKYYDKNEEEQTLTITIDNIVVQQ